MRRRLHMRVWTRCRGLSWEGAVTFKCDFQVLNREWCRVVCMATPPCRFLSFLAISNPEVRISDFRISRECQVSVTISMLYGLFEQRALSRSILGSPVKVFRCISMPAQSATKKPYPFTTRPSFVQQNRAPTPHRWLCPRTTPSEFYPLLQWSSQVSMIQPGFNVGWKYIKMIVRMSLYKSRIYLTTWNVTYFC